MTKGRGRGAQRPMDSCEQTPFGGGDKGTAATALTDAQLWMKSGHVSPYVHFSFQFIVSRLFPKFKHFNFPSTPALYSIEATSQ